MAGPKNASVNADGFRFYQWGDTDVLSVTSIRKLCGEPFTLVNWQINNIIDVVLSTRKQEKIGPRGGVSTIRVANEFPGEFARRLAATDGRSAALDDLRKWLRSEADEPRDSAARRGSIVHSAIEHNILPEQITPEWVASELFQLSKKDRDRVNGIVPDEDVTFIRSAVVQYWDMRSKVPFVIIAREPQIFNLTAGYAGSADALVWVLPEDRPDLWEAVPPKAADITQMDIEAVGGYTVLADWKTSKGVYTDHVTQVHAYMAGEFVGKDGEKDERLSEILRNTLKGALVHIRPSGWDVSYVDFREDILYAFLGSCAFARFLARYPDPAPLFTHKVSGAAGKEAE